MVLLIQAFRNYFNPRTLQESATADSVVFDLLDELFQSTHPTRECDFGKTLQH